VAPIHTEKASTVSSVFGAARNSTMPSARAANRNDSVFCIEKRWITQPAPMLPATLNRPRSASAAPETLAGRPHSSITPGRCVTRKKTCMPHTKKVALMSQNSRLASASRTVALGCAAAFAPPAAGPRRKASASGSAAIDSAAIENIAVVQPASVIRPWVAGASRSWPSGPPAPMMPATRPRFSGVKRALTVPTRSEGLPTVAATPATPRISARTTALPANGSSAPQAAASSVPAAMMRAAP